jgi:hypothetical protein
MVNTTLSIYYNESLLVYHTLKQFTLVNHWQSKFDFVNILSPRVKMWRSWQYFVTDSKNFEILTIFCQQQ